ncbi:MAG: response regulator [bacterium]|nr:response regulator [bacterium]
MQDANITTATILVIDDDYSVRGSISGYLSDFDYHVIEASDGQVGLELFSEEKPDMVLVDLHMPRVDGLEVLAEVTKREPQTPIVVVSGAGIVRDAVEALQRGAWDYITKPIDDLSILLHSVRKNLELARLIKENKNYRENQDASLSIRTSEFLHQFDNILTAIFGFIELSMSKLEPGSDIVGHLNGAQAAADRAAGLVKEILGFYRREISNTQRMVNTSPKQGQPIIMNPGNGISPPSKPL